MKYEVINSDNITALKNYPDNYFDSIVTDPPYGLGKEPDAIEVMTAWATTGYHEIKGTGFMGKEWDAFVPQPLFWKEVFRVLKPGGHCLAFYGTRTYDWGVMAMRFAGFEVRDCIQWLYGSGFPKSYNVAKGMEGKLTNGSSSWNKWQDLDGDKEERKLGYTKINHEQGNRPDDYSKGERTTKVNFTTNEAKEWYGWGSALKPANEPIVLARKPLEKGLSIVDNVLKWGVGGINIDGCRVSTEENLGRQQYAKTSALKCSNYEDKFFEGNPSGRFPANIILTHHPECECKQNEEKDWNCHPDCPIKILDEQSGITKSQRSERGNIIDNNVYGKYKEQEDTLRGHSDKGGASRFFYVAKASKSERNKGLDEFDKKQTVGGGGGIGNYLDDINSASGKYGSEKAPSQNFHPTVKPIKLMQYLVRLITPPNGLVLDPFCGSGTTGIACKIEGFNFIGIEQDAEYCKIAEARIKGKILEAKQNELF